MDILIRLLGLLAVANVSGHDNKSLNQQEKIMTEHEKNTKEVKAQGIYQKHRAKILPSAAVLTIICIAALLYKKYANTDTYEAQFYAENRDHAALFSALNIQSQELVPVYNYVPEKRPGSINHGDTDHHKSTGHHTYTITLANQRTLYSICSIEHTVTEGDIYLHTHTYTLRMNDHVIDMKFTHGLDSHALNININSQLLTLLADTQILVKYFEAIWSRVMHFSNTSNVNIKIKCDVDVSMKLYLPDVYLIAAFLLFDTNTEAEALNSINAFYKYLIKQKSTKGFVSILWEDTKNTKSYCWDMNVPGDIMIN